MKQRKAIFLDRDGTINVDKGYVYKLEDLKFEEGAIEGLEKLSSTDYLRIIVTNQSGIGVGYYTENDFLKYMDAMICELKANDININGVYFCPHHFEKGIGNYKIDCDCRKPGIGLIQQAVKEFREKDIEILVNQSYAIGDKTSDGKMANNAGCSAVLVNCESGKKGEDGRCPDVIWDYEAEDLNEAADWILSREV